MNQTDRAESEWSHAHLVSLLSSAGFKVAEFRCPGMPEFTEVECAPHPEIVLPRRGTYLRADAAGEVLLDRTTLAFFEANRPYTIRHFRPEPDLTTVISITDTASLHEALGVQLPERRTFARSAIRMPADIVLSHKQLLTELAKGPDGLLAAEEIAASIIIRSLALNLDGERELTRQIAPGTKQHGFEVAAAVIEYLSRAYTQRVTLEQVSAAVGLSIFHLCRVFQSATGNTIHQHLLSTRLDAAMADLIDTNRSVTEIAHAVGFSSHSHLTALFTRRFGAAPSKVRSGAFKVAGR